MKYRSAIELLEDMASTPAQKMAVEVAVGAIQDVMEAACVLRSRGKRAPLTAMQMREVLADVHLRSRRQKWHQKGRS